MSVEAARLLFQKDYHEVEGITPYILNKRRQYTDEAWKNELDKMQKSSTVYIGNLSFYTTEEQIYELFSITGQIKRIIIGLNQQTKTPCGFAFVEYYTHQEAIQCQRCLDGTMCDERIIRVALDPAFTEGRQFGRGQTGGQVRDEMRENYDVQRDANNSAGFTNSAERPQIKPGNAESSELNKMYESSNSNYQYNSEGNAVISLSKRRKGNQNQTIPGEDTQAQAEKQAAETAKEDKKNQLDVESSKDEETS